MHGIPVPKFERQLGKNKYEVAIEEMNERGLDSICMYKWSGAKPFTTYIDRVGTYYVERREYDDGHKTTTTL